MDLKVEIKEDANRQLTPYKRKTDTVFQAEAILKRIKTGLKMKMYHYLCAFDALECVPVQEKIDFCTDGTRVYYNPKTIISKEKAPGMDYLEYKFAHIVAHGLLGHFETTKEFRNQELSNVIMDAQVKVFLDKIGVHQDSRSEGLFGERDDLRPEEVTNGFSSYYKALQSKVERKKWAKRASTYYIDDHQYWQQPDSGKWICIRNMILGAASENMSPDEYMQAMLQAAKPGENNAGNGYGNLAGNETQLVRAAAENDMSYRELLTQLVKERETVKEEPDSLDVMLYGYGLELYGDVPLVEPSEVNEVKKLNSLVIAIDTSGSCEGETVGMFLRETYNLLRDLQDIAQFEAVYLMQCDTEIQDEKCFTNQDNLEELLEQELYGFGGTSFVPVFRRIEELQQNDDVEIEALLYLTDTEGLFPAEQPDYPVYLIIPEEDTRSDGTPRNTDIPDWADYIIIRE